MARASKKLESLSFEQILERLEGVVEKLEKGDAPLAEALATFEEGVGLSRLGSQHLDEAERRIEILLQDAEGVRTRSMDKESAFDE
ncbi:MAG: exodeoxyribonuclease VII small subunit [Myxococcales bacterium]|nr:exodeoxyribonuclease VII small subunit [Myxococcales bacterium]MDD9965543.1 exodeoxyribonuclease VII small subunit [Myxococcales bacterium]